MSIIIFKHNPQDLWCIFHIVWQVLKFRHGSSRALTVTTIHEKPFPLFHYCGTGALALLRQPKQRVCCSAWPFVTTLQSHRTSRSRSDQYFWTIQPLSLARWSKTWEFDDSTLNGKWKWLFVSIFQYKSPIYSYTKMEFLISYQVGANTSAYNIKQSHWKIVTLALGWYK